MCEHGDVTYFQRERDGPTLEALLDGCPGSGSGSGDDYGLTVARAVSISTDVTLLAP